MTFTLKISKYILKAVTLSLSKWGLYYVEGPPILTVVETVSLRGDNNPTPIPSPEA